MLLSRWLYYLSSIPTLAAGVRNWPAALARLLRPRPREPFLIELRPSRLRLKVRSALDVWIVKEVCLDRQYEPPGFALEDGAIVLDVGAGLGDFAIDLAARHPNSVVYAYEPNAHSFALLKENVELNGLTNVQAEWMAMGQAAQLGVLRAVSPEAAQDSTAPSATPAGATATEVPCTTLGEILGCLPEGRPVALKMDCEGAEYEILFHAGDEVFGRIGRMVLEYHDGVTQWSHGDLEGFLRRKGFHVELRPSRAHRHLGLLFARRQELASGSAGAAPATHQAAAGPPPQGMAPRRRSQAPILHALAFGLAVGFLAALARHPQWVWDWAPLLLLSILAFAAARREVRRSIGGPDAPLAPLKAPRPMRLAFLGRGLIVGAAFALTIYVLQALPGMSPMASYRGVVLAWLMSLGLFVAGVVPFRRPMRAHRAREGPSRRWIVLALCGIALAAAVLRVWRIGSIPFTIAGDEASQGMEALRVIRGEIRNPFTTGWLSVPTMSFFFDSLSFRLIQDRVLALRLPWACVGVATVLTAYLLITRLHGRQMGLLTAGLLAAYHYHIHFSRLGSAQIADPLFASLALLFLYRALERKSALDWLLSGAVCGLALYSYAGARFVPVLVFVTLAYWVLAGRRRFVSEHRFGPLIALGSFTIVAAPMLQLAVRFPNEFAARVNQTGIIQSGWLAAEMKRRSVGALPILFDQFLHAALAFNYYMDETVWYGLRGPLLDPIFGAVFVLGLGYATVKAFGPREGRRLFPLAAWWWGAVALGGMLTLGPPCSQRLITLAVPVCFFIALALAQLVQLAQRAFPRLPANAALAGAAILFAAISVKTYFLDFTPQRIFGGPHAEIATELAPVLNELKSWRRFYFLGAPSMYWGFPTIPFLAPGAQGEDIVQPLTAPPPAELKPPGQGIAFIFLPERLGQLKYVRATFPGGTIQEVHRPSDGRVTVTLYVVSL